MSQFIEIGNQEKTKAYSLETVNTEMRVKLESRNADIARLQSESDVIKKYSDSLSLQLSHETIAKNRAEAKLEILEPQLHALNQEINAMRTIHMESQQSK